MALHLANATRRAALPAARAARRGIVPLRVRAFKDSASTPAAAADGQQQQQQQQQGGAGAGELAKQQPAAAPAAPRPRDLLWGPSALALDAFMPRRVSSLFAEMEREMDALSRAVWGGDAWPAMAPAAARRAGAAAAEPAPAAARWRLATDVKETDREFLIHADVPGMTKDDIKVTVHEGVLSIKGERNYEAEEKEGDQVKWMERSHGTFLRSFALPEGVDADAIAAKVESGVLTVRVPKVEAPPKPEPKEIPVADA
ncbi:hypothetical protein Rsub_01202 [Raphidocelis subcapitata]|uniref:SHSP domain-containing protein n=1 Tax=Raphidocelis subcapitata TaxID=307507 RepID=A0A2V0NMV1_9CHLO|nr:hypothetical protein Rsub_01202 [Raphidocelis subcapitata]|eukprot:GBF88489.1 hypothetical protein Rsub_01202 [Raphidocelis subcapitata]